MSFSLGDLAQGRIPVHHHALLLVGSRLPESGLPPWALADIARNLCGISLPLPPVDASQEGSSGEAEFWARAAAHPDVVIVDREAGTIKLDDIAPIRDRALFPATQGHRRLFFLDRCERLQAGSANALLKVLEEPAAPCLFVFTARSLRNVLPTIASRCQRLAIAFPRDEKGDHGEREGPARPEGGGTFPSVALASLDESDAKDLSKFFRAGTARAMAAGVASGLSPIARASRPTPGARALRSIVERSEAFGRKYDAETLIDACLACALEAHREGRLPMHLLRFVKEDLRAWREALVYHPSSTLWLGRILMRLV